MEPQINADERRLNESAERTPTVAFEVSNILDKKFFEKYDFDYHKAHKDGLNCRRNL
ncbi:MAG: hypothetical protein WA144_08810 [Candidatus Methanoperedens sp.]